MKLFKSLPKKYLIEIKALLQKNKKYIDKTSFKNLLTEYTELEIDDALFGLDTTDKERMIKLKKKIKSKTRNIYV